MIVLYLLLRLVLALLHGLVALRVGRLEKRYVRLAAAADSLLKASTMRGGTNRTDPYVSAKQQYELARLALKRDHVENRYTSWQTFSERFGHLRRGLAGYRGSVLPYVFGMIDIGTVAVVLNQYAIGLSDIRAMLGL